MEDATFALALVLGVGLLIAKLAQLLKLPSVTGYICAGLALGQSGLGLITGEMIEARLVHFTQIALMLIAFGIGEHLEIKKLRYTARSVLSISFFEGMLTFILVVYGTFFTLYVTDIAHSQWNMGNYLALAFLFGSVAIATAPASTMHVIREVQATGPMTTTLLQVVVINNAMAVMMFGVVIAVVSNMASSGQGMTLAMLVSTLGRSLLEISASLVMGFFTGFLIDFIVRRLSNRAEMLIAGLSLLLLCGEAARMLNYSPLLAGMAAGFAIVNQDLRDVRLFRLLNSFEPPIYVLFFALAGAHLDVSYFATAGWLGLTYFVFRAVGKFLGASFGARISETSAAVRDNIGYALIPQAGIAIGLVFLVREQTGLEQYSAVMTTVVLAGVFLSELIGPVSAKYAMEKAGEAMAVVNQNNGKAFSSSQFFGTIRKAEEFHLIPWTWERLQPSECPIGAVIFGVSNIKTLGGLTRMATIMAHYHGALPVATRILPVEPSFENMDRVEETHELFSSAREEALKMGYRLEATTVPADDVASGILEAAGITKTWAIILGHPLVGEADEFQRVVERVAEKAPCQVVVVRFAGVLHTEKILVPVTSINELDILRDVIAALAKVGRHKITLLFLVHPEAAAKELETVGRALSEWIWASEFSSSVQSRVVATEARLETIVREARDHDLVVISTSPAVGLKRLFFGSLAESVAQHCGKTILMVRGPAENGLK